MSCFEPMIRLEEASGAVHFLSMKKYEDLKDKGVNWEDSFLYIESMQTIPCGRCEGCQAARAKAWADRLMIENTLHEDSWFVTLTFNDTWMKKLCSGTKYSDCFTLRKDLLQKFIKRLRRDLDVKIRYFGCGEYGSNGRPHYHLIIFGLHLDDEDLLYLRKNKLGQSYYSSKLIERYWSDPEVNWNNASEEERAAASYGFNVVGKVEYNSCAYVARYCMKKLKENNKIYYEAAGMQPPFVTMSRDPGIGYWYMIQHPDWAEQSLIYLSTSEGSLGVVPPRYFEKKLALRDPQLVKLRSMERTYLRSIQEDARLSQTDKNRYEYVKTVESNLKKSFEVLHSLRNMI